MLVFDIPLSSMHSVSVIPEIVSLDLFSGQWISCVVDAVLVHKVPFTDPSSICITIRVQFEAELHSALSLLFVLERVKDVQFVISVSFSA